MSQDNLPSKMVSMSEEQLDLLKQVGVSADNAAGYHTSLGAMTSDAVMQIRWQRTEIERLTADAARLDWLDKYRISIFQANPAIQWQGFGIETGRTLREQVDAHMAVAASLSPSAELKPE